MVDCGGQNRDKKKPMYVSTPYQLKEASVIDASPTPPTIGISEEIIHIFGTCKIKNDKEAKVKYHNIITLNKKKIINSHLPKKHG